MRKITKLAIGAVLTISLVFGMILFLPRLSSAQEGVVLNLTASILTKDNSGAFKGGWSPNKIEVKEGQKVTINLISNDIDHEFIVPEYNISEKFDQEHPATVTFVADKPGTYKYVCHCSSIHCSPYHKKMVGQLIVQPKQ